MKRPAITIPDTVSVATPSQELLANGTTLYTIASEGQNVVRISLVFTAGTSTQTSPFVASATENLLSEGTLRHTAAEIAERLDYYGSYYEVSCDRDYAVLTFCSLTRFFDSSIDVFEEILTEPAFSENEIRIYADNRKQALAIERSKATTRARELFAQKLYGASHPYGISSPESCYDNLTRSNIIEFYRTHYVSGNCFAVCSTDTDTERLQRIRTFVGNLPQGISTATADIPEAHSEKYCREAFKGAAQASIRIGKVLFGRQHPDFVGMQVVSYILGGYFGSRLIQNLRERNGFTYSAFASIINLRASGYAAFATDVGCEHTEQAVTEIYNEIRRLAEEPISTTELEMVRRIMFGEFMRILDGPMGIVDVTIEAVQSGTDNGYINRALQEVRGITPERISALTLKYLDIDALTTVIVGQ